jgi:hypothetical protein
MKLVSHLTGLRYPGSRGPERAASLEILIIYNGRPFSGFDSALGIDRDAKWHFTQENAT